MMPLFLCAALVFSDAKQPREVAPVPQAEVDLAGIYRSVTLEGGKRSIAAVTVERVGQSYVVHWSSGAKGVGLRNADSLSVGWTMDLGGGVTMRGVTVYTIQGRTLRGRWAALIPGKVVVSEETLTWLGDGGEE